MNITVVAHKFNDILFAVETDEFKRSHKKILLVFQMPNMKKSDFPFLDKFDRVLFFKYDKINIRTNILKFIFFILKNRAILKSNLIFLSNPHLLYNKIYARLLSVEEIILLEDGLMNYVEQNTFVPFGKKLIQKLLLIDYDFMSKKIIRTYLSNPENAVLFSGKKNQISLSRVLSEEIENQLSLVKNKKLFIGQNLYPLYCNEKEYYNAVKRVIDKYQIDYYIPHAYELYNNQLGDIKVYRVRKYTFEYLAQFEKFSLYSFSSSLLFTAKMINPSVESILIRIPECQGFYVKQLLENCNKVFFLDDI